MPASAAQRRRSNGLPSGPACIYALVDPDGTIRYVGKTDDPAGRLADHMKAPSNEFEARWLFSLRRAGKAPVVIVLQRVRPRDVLTCERDWVEWITFSYDLLNVRHGKMPERARRRRTSSAASPGEGP